MISFRVSEWVKRAEFDSLVKGKDHEECCWGSLDGVVSLRLTHPLRSFTNRAAGEEFLTPISCLSGVKYNTSNYIRILYSW